MIRFKQINALSLVLICCVFLFIFGACSSDSKAKGKGDLVETQYCKRYKTFDKSVATDEYKDQLEKLEEVRKTKDLPSELKKDYDFVIKGYKKVLNDEPVSKDEDKYEAAIKRISRHAIEHCDLLESNTGSNGGI